MNLQMEITTVPGLDRPCHLEAARLFLSLELSLDISLWSVWTFPYFGLFLGHFDLANIDAVLLRHFSLVFSYWACGSFYG